MGETYISYSNDEFPGKNLPKIEAHIFAIAPNDAKIQDVFDEDIYITDSGGKIVFPSDTTNNRKKAMNKFNELIKSMKKETIAHVEIDFIMADADYNDENIKNAYHNFRQNFVDWGRITNRPGIIVPHLKQGLKYAHAHILYLWKSENEFQDYLTSIYTRKYAEDK